MYRAVEAVRLPKLRELMVRCGCFSRWKGFHDPAQLKFVRQEWHIVLNLSVSKECVYVQR